MEQLNLKTKPNTEFNLEALYQICPACFTEVRDETTGELRHVVDFDKLKAFLGEDVAEDVNESYEFTWVGKQEARREAAKPITKTLRPCIEESVDWDTTKNLYIEGDNLEVLKLLQNSYMGKVKMIYIDPPYNTGNDFIYHDDFTQNRSDYDLDAGNVDEEGNRFRKNTETNGRFHSDWCSMMYPRLLLARNFLSNEGIIFISIDDHEIQNLKKICDETLGESNFVAQFIWEKKKKPSFLNSSIGVKTEYVLCYAKNRTALGALSVDLTEKGKNYPINNAGNGITTLTFPPRSVTFTTIKNDTVKKQNMSAGNIITELLNDVIIENGINKNEFKLRGEFRYSQSRLDEIIANEELITISKVPFRPNHEKSGGEIKKMHNLLTLEQYPVGSNEDASAELINIFGKSVFEFTKPTSLIKFLMKCCTYKDKDCLVMDFFSGSATAAQSLLQLNIEDGGRRQFIMVQLPEVIDPNKTSTDKAKKIAEAAIDFLNSLGLQHTICELGKERIRRAGQKIKDEHGLIAENLDIGFRVFKCDESNMKDVYFEPKDLQQQDLINFMDNVKKDRTDLDLLFDCMLKWGVQLSEPIAKKSVGESTIYNVNDGDLVACFSEKVTREVIDQIADLEPLRVVFRDGLFEEVSEKMNLFEIFKQKCDWSDDEVRKNVRVI